MKTDIKKLLTTPLFYFYGLSLSGCHTAVSSLFPNEVVAASSRTVAELKPLDLSVSSVGTAAATAAATACLNLADAHKNACAATAAFSVAISCAIQAGNGYIADALYAAADTATVAYAATATAARKAYIAYKEAAEACFKLAQYKSKTIVAARRVFVRGSFVNIPDAYINAQAASTNAQAASTAASHRNYRDYTTCFAAGTAYNAAAADVCIFSDYCTCVVADFLKISNNCKNNMVVFIDGTRPPVYASSSAATATVGSVFGLGSDAYIVNASVVDSAPIPAIYTRSSAAGYFAPPATLRFFPSAAPPAYDSAVVAGYNTSNLIGNQTNKRKQDNSRTTIKKQKQ